jgi:hypothetical protein
VLGWEHVTARRVARSGLAEPLGGPDGAGAAAVARALCGVHAQVLTAAELSVGRRLAGATRSDVQRALWEDRTVVKTFGPRGTVHLLATDDLPMWTGALSTLPTVVPQHPPPVRFTPDEAEAVIAGIGEALADAELTVDELTDDLNDRVGPWAGERTMEAFQDRWPRWRQLTSTAAHRGVLCFGANRGRKVTYTNPHRWKPGFRPDDGPGAPRDLVVAYLRAYGPATSRHFAQWVGIPPRRAADLFTELSALDPSPVEAVDVDLGDGDLGGDPAGGTAWVVAGDTAPDVEADVARGVRLLPYFDAFVVAGQPRARLFPGRASERALSPTGQAGNYPVLLLDGVVGGVWHQRRSGRRLTLTVEPLADLTAARRRLLDEEVGRVGEVMEGDPTLTVGPVAVGPHA